MKVGWGPTLLVCHGILASLAGLGRVSRRGVPRERGREGGSRNVDEPSPVSPGIPSVYRMITSCPSSPSWTLSRSTSSCLLVITRPPQESFRDAAVDTTHPSDWAAYIVHLADGAPTTWETRHGQSRVLYTMLACAWLPSCHVSVPHATTALEGRRTGRLCLGTRRAEQRGGTSITATFDRRAGKKILSLSSLRRAALAPAMRDTASCRSRCCADA